MHASLPLVVLGPRSRGLGPGQNKRASGPDDGLLEKDEASGDAYCALLYGDWPGFFCAPSTSRSSSAPSPLTRAEVRREEDSGARTESSSWAPRTTAAPNVSGRSTWPTGRTFIVKVEAINGANLSATRRHNAVFTKLQVFLLPYLHTRGSFSWTLTDLHLS